MGGGVGHAASAAGGTEAAALAREGDKAIELAVVAVQAQEPVLEDAAAQVGAELLQDEAGDRLVPLAGALQEGLELVAHGPVQQRVLGRARFVLADSVCGPGRTRGPVTAGGYAGGPGSDLQRHDAHAQCEKRARPSAARGSSHAPAWPCVHAEADERFTRRSRTGADSCAPGTRWAPAEQGAEPRTLSEQWPRSESSSRHPHFRWGGRVAGLGGGVGRSIADKFPRQTPDESHESRFLACGLLIRRSRARAWAVRREVLSAIRRLSPRQSELAAADCARTLCAIRGPHRTQ